MSRFNKPSTVQLTPNMAGAPAHAQTPELELISLLLTSFAQDSFYKSADDTLPRIGQLVKQVDPYFAAQAAVYARTVFGMRSITHVLASKLAPVASGKPWAKDFYNKIVYRLDDMTEILAYHEAQGQKRSNAMLKGFAAAFDRFNGYQIAKYKGEGKGFKLVDAVNLVHPVPGPHNEETLEELVKGTLKNTETWEAMLSVPGADKALVWKTLLNEQKLGYLALLRNLRNILQQAPDSLPAAIAALTDPAFIKRSLIMPFQFVTALEEIEKLPGDSRARVVMVALNKATDISCSNVPVFAGETLVVLDTSGSMTSQVNPRSKKTPAQIGALFAAVLVKSCNADFMTFNDHATYLNMNPSDSTITLARSVKYTPSGTDFRTIFNTANKKYDRVIILSDMQGWIGGIPASEVTNYRHRYSADPFIYSFDLQNYGTMQFPQKKVFTLAGFSDKIFDVMRALETDKNALINAVKATSLI